MEDMVEISGEQFLEIMRHNRIRNSNVEMRKGYGKQGEAVYTIFEKGIARASMYWHYASDPKVERIEYFSHEVTI